MAQNKTLEELEKTIYKYLKGRGWQNLRPSDLAKSIAIESGELLELFQWENLSLKEVKKDNKKVQEIQNELADVLIYALDMAVLLGVDTEKVIRKKLADIKRKYPAKLMKKGRQGTGADSEYWRIKKEYRRRAAR